MFLISKHFIFIIAILNDSLPSILCSSLHCLHIRNLFTLRHIKKFDVYLKFKKRKLLISAHIYVLFLDVFRGKEAVQCARIAGFFP